MVCFVLFCFDAIYVYIQTSPVELEVDGEGEKNGNIILLPGSISSGEENDEVVVVVVGEEEEEDSTSFFIEDVRSFCIMDDCVHHIIYYIEHSHRIFPSLFSN